MLDARAKTQYRKRLAELRVDQDEAETFHDPERAARARAEYTLLAAELALAVGLGGRDRRAGSPEERARLNVTRAIRTSVQRLGEHDPALGAYLAATVLTGRACVYRPERAVPMRWRVMTQTPSRTALARRFESPETHYAQAGEVSIAYQVLGEGELDILFVPGVISHLDLLWEDPATASFYRRLATLGRLIMFDKRDTGLSDRAHGDASLEERMDDVQAIMAACGSRQAALFGYSEGGPMSILFAATYPERVSALILGAAAARWPSAPDYPCGRSSDEMLDALEHIASHPARVGEAEPARFSVPVASVRSPIDDRTSSLRASPSTPDSSFGALAQTSGEAPTRASDCPTFTATSSSQLGSTRPSPQAAHFCVPRERGSRQNLSQELNGRFRDLRCGVELL